RRHCERSEAIHSGFAVYWIASPLSGLAMTIGAYYLLRREGLDAGLGAAQDEGVDVVGALIGIDRLQVHDMTDDMVFIRYAVAAVHVARHAGDVQGLAAGVALDQRDRLRGELALILQAPGLQASQEADGNFRLHVGKLF